MKWFICFNFLGLLLVFFVSSSYGMMKEEFTTPSTLKALCIKNIKREIRKDPFFAFKEAERLQKKVLSKSQNPKNEHEITEKTIYDILNSCELVLEQPKEDPPFFFLKNEGKEIYIS